MTKAPLDKARTRPLKADPVLHNLLAELRAGRFRPRAIRKFIKEGVSHAVSLAWSLSDLRRSFFMASAVMLLCLAAIGAALHLTIPQGLGTSTVVAEASLFIVVFVLTLLQLGLVRAEKTHEVYDRFVLPNVLTLMRLLLIPYVIRAMMAGKESYAPLATLLLLFAAVITDTLDGTISRRFGLASDFGRIYDPVVDIFFHSALAITLYRLEEVGTLYLASVLARYLLPPVAGLFLVISGRHVQVKSTIMGKISSLFLSVFICLLWMGYAFSMDVFLKVARHLEPLCVAVCLATVIFFLGFGLRIIRKSRLARPRAEA